MSRITTCRRAVLAVIATVMSACGQDPIQPHQPPTFSVVAGDDQSGAAGLSLDPLIVKAMDNEGNPVDGVEVAWFVTTGEGLFPITAGGEVRLVSSLVNLTNKGVAKAVLLPTSVGTVTVTAYASTSSWAPIGSASFTAHMDAVAITLDDSIDWETPWPAGPQGVTVDAGTPVQWQPKPPCCGNHLMSIEVPAGGTPFDTVLAASDSLFELVPDAPGTWTWAWEHSIDDWWLPVIVTDTATLVVQSPT